MQKFRGWRRLTSLLLPKHLTGAFRVSNKHGCFSGNLNSFIDRQIYLTGGYEEDRIDAFLAVVQARGRCGTILDVGANVGTHSIAFANCFEQVHAFEPNAALWSAFETNVSNSKLANVQLHKFGLSDAAGHVPFYAIAKDNAGLGTALSVEQYDLPLQQIDVVDLQTGDDWAGRHNITQLDAIKIDVQGLEPQVLKGLSRTLQEHRPVTWVEVGTTNVADDHARQWISKLVSGPIEILRFETARYGPTNRTRLVAVSDDQWDRGDYVFIPK